MKIKNAAYIITLLFLSSCGSYKHIPYFQDLKPSEVSQEEVSNFSAITIQKADILGINVNSRNPESSAIFNYNLNRANGPSMDQPSDSPVVGYLVDEKGEINLPLIGNMKVAGMTTSELREKLGQTLL